MKTSSDYLLFCPRSRPTGQRATEEARHGAPRLRALGAAFLLAAATCQSPAAEDCAERAVQWQEINVGSGIYTERAVASTPLMLQVPVHVDAEFEAECLKLEGFDPAATMAAALERSERCRAQARRVRLVRNDEAGGTPRIGGEVDDTIYRECLRQEIEVEVLPEP